MSLDMFPDGAVRYLIEHSAWTREDGTPQGDPAAEARLRSLIASQPYFGEWDEWAPLAYNRIPVMARAVMLHIYGRHDDSPLPYSCCVLCALLRTDAT